MDDELKPKIVETHDTPDALDRALSALAARARSESDWEALALAIDARVAAVKASQTDVPSPDEPDPAAFPEFDEPTPMMESKQVMSNEYDADLENLAALTRTSLGPGAMPAAPRSVAPSIMDEIDDTSSGIVDIKKLAQVAHSAASMPPPAALSPALSAPLQVGPPQRVEEPAKESVTNPSVTVSSAAAKGDARVSPPSKVIPVAQVPEPRKSHGAFWGAFGGIAVSAAAFFFVQSQDSSPLRSAQEVASVPTASQDLQATAPGAVPLASPRAVAESQAPRPEPTLALNDQAVAMPALAAPTALLAPTAMPPVPSNANERGAAPESAGALEGQGAGPQGARARREHGGAAESDMAADRPSHPHSPSPPSHVQAVTPTVGVPSAPSPARVPTPPTAPVAAPPTPTPTPPVVVAPSPAAPARNTALAANAPPDNSIGRLLEQVAPGPSRSPAQQAVETPTTELPVRPNRQMITAQMTPLNGAVRACMQGATGTIPVTLVIGSDGAVRSARVSGEHAGDDVGSCVSNVVQRAHFPPFTATQVSVTWPFVILPPR